jgi:hypothetical protein
MAIESAQQLDLGSALQLLVLRKGDNRCERFAAPLDDEIVTPISHPVEQVSKALSDFSRLDGFGHGTVLLLAEIELSPTVPATAARSMHSKKGGRTSNCGGADGSAEAFRSQPPVVRHAARSARTCFQGKR